MRQGWWIGLLALLWSGGLAAAEGGKLDATPRIAVLSAFPPEMALLRSKAGVERTETVNGVPFTLATLAGRPVVLFESGVSMVNATMTAQLALDRFKVTALVFSGIAGGVDPGLAIGDVVVPERWAQYLEAVFARAEDGAFAPPPWATTPVPSYGMIHPMPVTVRSAAVPAGESVLWLEVDPKLLAVARGLEGKVGLAACPATGDCLASPPRLVVGGEGVSGQAFVDNAAFREWVKASFGAEALDMESAAVATVARANAVPFIAFRSLSDLAGGGPGANEMGTFLALAADNAATAVLAFLAALPPTP